MARNKIKWLVEFEETEIVDTFDGSTDAMSSGEELVSFINAWIADDPQRAKWLRAVTAVKLNN